MHYNSRGPRPATTTHAHRLRAVEYLRAKGGPQLKSTVGRDCNIPAGSYHTVFSANYFTHSKDGKVGLTGSRNPFGFQSELRELVMTKPEPKVKPTPDQYKEALITALSKQQPQELAELNRNTLVPQAAIFKTVKEHPELFVREEHLYWLAGVARREGVFSFASGDHRVPYFKKPILNDNS